MDSFVANVIVVSLLILLVMFMLDNMSRTQSWPFDRWTAREHARREQLERNVARIHERLRAGDDA